MKIEFLGVSGVGKTTVAKLGAKNSLKKGKRIKWPRYHLYEKHGWLSRNMIKAIDVLGFTVENPSWVIKLNRIIRKADMGFSDYINILFNSIHLKVMDSRIQRDKVCYFDEGALQLLWGIMLRAKSDFEDEDMVSILSMYHAPDKVIVVTADTDTILKRLKKRNTYTRILKEDNLYSNIDRMKRIQARIIDTALQHGIVHEDSVIYYDNNEDCKINQ